MADTKCQYCGEVLTADDVVAQRVMHENCVNTYRIDRLEERLQQLETRVQSHCGEED